MKPLTQLNSLKKKALQNEAVKEEYQALEAEFELTDTLMTMRSKAGLTQEQIAERMGTQKSNISRLERGNGNPSWHTLQKYAKACGFQLSVAIEELG